jgi:hypothetical protein
MSTLHLLKKILCGGLLVFVLATTYSQQNKNLPAPVKVASVEGIMEFEFTNSLLASCYKTLLLTHETMSHKK